MRLLFLTPQRPYPTHQGTTIRNFFLIHELAKRHQIWLLTFLEADQPNSHGPLRHLCKAIETIPVPRRSTWTRLHQMVLTQQPDMAWRLYSSAFQSRLVSLLQTQDFDVIQIEGIEMAPYLPAIRQFAKQAKIIYDDHNAEWLLQYRNFQVDLKKPRRWLAALYSYVQTRRLKRYERWVCQMSDGVVVCSDADQQALQQLDSQINPVVVPNGVDLDAYRRYQGDVISFDLVFTGKMDYRPNIDAVLWFGTRVMPHILAVRPNTTFAIVGQRPHSRLDPLRSNPAITITGYVDEVLPYIGGAKVYIAPFRIGGGTRLKLLEAMAMKKPIVATSVGAEGYPIESGREMIIVDDPREIATEVVRLLDEVGLGNALGEQAYQFVETNYTWPKIVPRLEALYVQSS